METHETKPRPERLPAPTYAPAIVAAALVLIAWGAVTTVAIALLGLVLLVVGLTGWFAEIRREH